MKYRKLRIAWSVAWGVVAMLLVALWVRSYWWNERFAQTDYDYTITTLGSNRGVAYLTLQYLPVPDLDSYPWHYETSESTTNGSRFSYTRNGRNLECRLPRWFILIAFGIAASLPWIPWATRFSLRTLLIVTTLVAVGLGLIVWMR